MKDTNAWITRWYLALQPFKFQVVHRPGAQMAVADFLSRRRGVRDLATSMTGERIGRQVRLNGPNAQIMCRSAITHWKKHTLEVGKRYSKFWEKIAKLLHKGAIEQVHPSLSESGFYSRCFLVPKKDGALRPILDLRHLNKALMRRPFKMITTRQILAQIRPGDWFISLDLKDAYFQIQITPRHRPFLRFAFDGREYQYTVLPFGLSLAPRAFTKCMDTPLAPLRRRGMRILNYLDDWLIQAQSETELVSHRTALLSHLENLGLSVNWTKSSLSPRQSISFLG
ncbi:hypothetical protein PO909_025991 [Leuciscus waleckii]